jgi:hypothetical protein
VGVGVGRQLGEVGDAQHLPTAGEPGELAPDLERDGAPDAGVDLVEHHDGVASTSASASRTASATRLRSPPLAALASGSSGSPGSRPARR